MTGDSASPMADANDPGLLTPAETSLLIDHYELTMAASYLRRGRNEPAIFELFARRLPPHRDWLLAAGLGPTLRADRASCASAGASSSTCARSGCSRTTSSTTWADSASRAMSRRCRRARSCFANEPLIRVTAPRIEAQLLETLLLNQINFQTMIATKAARVVLAAGGGEPGAGERVIDFSPRRDHGVDAAMKVARSAAVAGLRRHLERRRRDALRPAPGGDDGPLLRARLRERGGGLRAFMEDFPQTAVLLVDTYDTLEGVRHAIAAARDTGIPLAGVRLDSGDLLELSPARRGGCSTRPE